MKSARSPIAIGMLICATALGGGLGYAQEVDEAKAAAEAKAAQAFIQDYLKEPDKLTVSEPLPNAPQAGKTFVWLNCDAPLCQVIGDGVKEATEAAGWTYEQINYSSADPATLSDAFRRALEKKPAAVATSGIPPEAGWGTVIPEYREAGVPIVLSYMAEPDMGPDYNDVVVASVASGSADRAFHGDLLGNWFIADSGGKGHALVQNIPAFTVLDKYSVRLREVIAEKCTACKITYIENTIDQAFGNGMIPAMIPEVQKDTSINYILASSLEYFDGLPSALSAANSKVKIGGTTPSLTGYELIKRGDIAAATTLALEYSGWLQVDAALRHAAGVKLDPGDEAAMPIQLVLPESDFTVRQSVDPKGFKELFKSLWHVK